MRSRTLPVLLGVLTVLGLAVPVALGWDRTRAQDVVPTPRGQLGGPAPLNQTPVPAAPGAPTANATDESETPQAGSCDVKPRSIESMLTLAGTPEVGQATPTGGETRPPDGLTDGPPADAGAVEGIRATLDELAACIAEGETRQGLALFTDDYIRRSVKREPADVTAQDEARPPVITIHPGVPRTVRVAFNGAPSVRDEDLRTLSDDRVGAVLGSPDDRDDSALEEAVPAAFIVFAEVDDRWLIDEWIVGSGAERTPEMTPVAGGMEPVDAVVRDAAARLGVGADEITLVRVERSEWPDAGLGCPQPGGIYAQVITPGYLVVVTGAGQELEYHTDDRGNAVLCEER